MRRQGAHGLPAWLKVSLPLTGLLLVAFNNCSDVNFSNSSSEVGGTGNPPVLVNYTDTFMIPAIANRADLLFVLDNSGSMAVDLTKLAERLDGLVQILDMAAVDWQMCYTTTDMSVASGNALNWYQSNGGTFVDTGRKVLKPADADKLAVFTSTMARLGSIGTGSGNEEAFLATQAAVDQPGNDTCFRPDAALSVITISDEDEKSCGGRCQNAGDLPAAQLQRAVENYTRQYRALTPEDSPQSVIDRVKARWPMKPFAFHAITIRPDDLACFMAQDAAAPAFFGVEYQKLQKATGGIFGDICAASYATQLQAIGQRTVDVINSVSLRCAPYGAPQVSIAPPASVTWRVEGNKIIFSAPLPQGTQVTVAYACRQ